MQPNVGSIDQKIRLLLGSVLFLTGLFAPLGFEWRAGILAVAVIAILTGAFSF